jgi:hypothetical protein
LDKINTQNTGKEEKKREKRQKNHSVCERMIHNKKYPKDKKYMGIHCHQKIYGDTLPIQNIWGYIAYTKYMGTHCQCKIYGGTLSIQNIWGHIAETNTWGQIANKKMGTLYQYCLQKYLYIQIITMHGMRTGVHSTLGSSPGNDLILILLSFLGNVTSLCIM